MKNIKLYLLIAEFVGFILTGILSWNNFTKLSVLFIAVFGTAMFITAIYGKGNRR